MKLVSIITPTRVATIDSFMTMLRSIKETASDFSQVEILLRMDDDDKERIALSPKLFDEFGAKTVVGPRGQGYIDMGVFVNDLAKVANSRWCWLVDDDAFVVGQWQQELSRIACDPDTGPCVGAEFYQLGESLYPNPPDNPVGLMMPTALVKTIDHRNPVDQQWQSIAQEKGWTKRLLKNVVYAHDGRPR